MRNEEANVARFLAALPSWLDEVVVVDNGSTDATASIAAAAGARVVKCATDDLSQARNAGLDATRAEWVLSIDVDEALTCTAWDSVYSLARHGARRAYKFPVRTVFGKAWSRMDLVKLYPSHLRWEGAFHESLLYDIRRTETPVTTISASIVHVENGSDLTAKRMRNVNRISAFLALDEVRDREEMLAFRALDLFALGEHARALRDLETARSEAPTLFLPRFFEAHLQRECGNLETALGSFEKLADETGLPSAQMGAAVTSAQGGRRDHAIKWLEAIDDPTWLAEVAYSRNSLAIRPGSTFTTDSNLAAVDPELMQALGEIAPVFGSTHSIQPAMISAEPMPSGVV